MKTLMTSDTDYEIGDVLTWSVDAALRYEATKTGPDEWRLTNSITPQILSKPFAWLRSVIERPETHGLTKKPDKATSQYAYVDQFLDIIGPMGPVEIEITPSVIWVHTDGRTVLRICRITDTVIINDHRDKKVAHQRDDCWCGRHHAPEDFL